MADPTGDPLEVSCPVCLAKKNKSCTYITEQPKKGNFYGAPTKKPHERRKSKAIGRVTAWKRKQAIKNYGPSPAVLAYRDAQVKEYEAMRKWLRRWYYVLTDSRVDGPPGSHS